MQYHLHYRIIPNVTIVQGHYGPLEYSRPSSKRRTKSLIMGRDLESKGNHQFEVLFQNGQKIVCPSSKLTIVPTASIPPSLNCNNQDVDELSIHSDSDEYVCSGEEDISEEENEDVTDEEVEVEDYVPDSQATDGPLLEECIKPEPETYSERVSEARRKIAVLEGTKVVQRTTYPRQSIEWTVVASHHALAPYIPSHLVGLREEVMNEIVQASSSNNCIGAEIFLRLMFGNKLDEKISAMNRAVTEFNISSGWTRPIVLFTAPEVLKCFALLIGASCFASKGEALFKPRNKNNNFLTLEANADFQLHVRDYRFREFRSFLPSMFKKPELKESDPWWQFVSAIDDFNNNRLATLHVSSHICVDEMMSAWRPQTTSTGGLPNITHIPRKPKPLGTEFKCSACCQTGCMLHLELQRGKNGMQTSRHNRELGATAGCTLRLAEERQELIVVD